MKTVELSRTKDMGYLKSALMSVNQTVEERYFRLAYRN
jgi:hypothetical protein